MTGGSHERALRLRGATVAPRPSEGRATSAARRPLAFTLRELLDAARQTGANGLQAVGVYCVVSLLSERSTADVARVAGCSRSTAKRALRSLEQLLDVADTPAVERPARASTGRTSDAESKGTRAPLDVRAGVTSDPGGSPMTPTGGSPTGHVPFGAGVPSALHGQTDAPPTRCAPRQARNAAAAWLRARGLEPRTRRFRRAMADLDRAWRTDGLTWNDPVAVAVRVVQAWYAEGADGILQLAAAHRSPTSNQGRTCSRCGSPLRGRCCVNARCGLYLHRQGE